MSHHCDAQTRAEFPGGVKSRSQYGDEIGILAAYFLVKQGVPNERMAQFLRMFTDSFMDIPRVKQFSIGCERVIGCVHLSGLKGAAI